MLGRPVAAAVCCAAALLLLPSSAAQARPSGNAAALQLALQARGLYDGTIDGIAGPGTAAAVRRLQARRGLAVDGIAGPATRRALGRRGRPTWGSRPVRAGMSGWDVAVLQFLLNRQGFPSGGIDGGFGPRLDAALRRFQAFAGLTADGVAGPSTRVALQRAPATSPLRFYRPVAGPVGDRYGPRGTRLHSGLDFPEPYGARVGAAGRGCVATVGWDPAGYGNYVVVQHRLGVTTWYAHLSSIAVRQGQCVTGGDLVGRVGSTGGSTGPHLHFEVRVRGATVDPLGAFL